MQDARLKSLCPAFMNEDPSALSDVLSGYHARHMPQGVRPLTLAKGSDRLRRGDFTLSEKRQSSGRKVPGCR